MVYYLLRYFWSIYFGQSNICHRLLDGIGTPKNYVEARQYCEAAAQKGDKLAYLGLGLIYLHGWGVAANPVQAYTWYLLANGIESEIWQISVDNQTEYLENILGVADINKAQKAASEHFAKLPGRR